MNSKFYWFAWLGTAALLVVVNGVSHGVLAADFFDAQLAPLGSAARKMADFDPLPVVLLEFAIVFVLLQILSSQNRGPLLLRDAARTGALLYFSTSATWNLGNLATLSHWPLAIVVPDVIFHTALGWFAGWVAAKIYNRQWRTGTAGG